MLAFGLALLLGLILLASLTTSTPTLPKTPEQQAVIQKNEWQAAAVAATAQALRASMKNPAAFQLEAARYTEKGAVCIQYRSTNSFNAVVPGFHVMADGKSVGNDTAFWNKNCANKPATDYLSVTRRMLER